MSIWDRLGNVLKSYFNEGAERIFGEDQSKWRQTADDDYNSAYEELNEFLKGDKTKYDRAGSQETSEQKTYNGRFIPPEIKLDYKELGLAPGANEEECKEAYKKLLKIHHPDRHGSNPELMKTSTEKTAKINAAYDRLEAWFKAGG